MSLCGLADLHIVPHGKTLTSDFYVDEVLKGMPASAMAMERGRTDNGPPAAVKHLSDMSQVIFQQD